jgi:hypothetical protein
VPRIPPAGTARVSPHITRDRFGLASRCTNLVDQDRKLGSGEGLLDAGGCAMPSNDRSRLCFINFRQRDHRWCSFRIIQRLKNRHAVRARVDVDNREIDLSALANFSAKIAVKNFFKARKTDFSLPHFNHMKTFWAKNESSLANNGQPEGTCEIMMMA